LLLTRLHNRLTLFLDRKELQEVVSLVVAATVREAIARWWNILGYVRGIFGIGSSPSTRRIGGTTRNIAGPIEPRINDQKMAGFSIAAQRRYRTGWEKNRGLSDIVLSRTVSRFLVVG